MAKKARKLRSLTIKPVENGYNVETEHEPDADDQGNGMSMYQPPKSHVFGHHEHAAMLDHVAQQIPPPKGVPQRRTGESYADMMARNAAEGRKGK